MKRTAESDESHDVKVARLCTLCSALGSLEDKFPAEQAEEVGALPNVKAIRHECRILRRVRCCTTGGVAQNGPVQNELDQFAHSSH